MGKRARIDADKKGAHAGQDYKRQRIEGSYDRNSPRPNGHGEEVVSMRDLQKALFFDQTAHADFCSGQ